MAAALEINCLITVCRNLGKSKTPFAELEILLEVQLMKFMSDQKWGFKKSKHTCQNIYILHCTTGLSTIKSPYTSC